VSRDDAQGLWERLSGDLTQRLPERTFRDWVSPCAPLSCDGETLWVSVPSASVKIWVEQQLAEEFHTSLFHIGAQDMRLVFTVGAIGAVGDAKGGADQPAAQGRDLDQGQDQGRDQAYCAAPQDALPQGFDRYTLDNFIEGSNSKLAFAAANGIVESYGRQSALKMNPFFIYGATGLGKTHLMVAIGKALVVRNPSVRLAYIKSDRFFHEVTTSIRAKSSDQLRLKYQSIDALLIDDVQLLKNLERTQEEIFYIFEHLHQHGNQVVITSDRPPDRLEGLHDRLGTRCKWGLIADLQPPDFETRFAIKKKKLEDPVFASYPTVPEDVLTFIASKVKASVRDLEGLLTRSIFQASFLNSAVTVEIAQEAYRSFTGEEPTAQVSVERVCKATAEGFGIPFGDLIKKKSRKKEVLLPRQVAMYLIRELTQASFAEIGKVFGDMHHSTVMNAIDSVKSRMQRDPDFNRTVIGLSNGIS
jgi:chromosomal replication initiator protein